MKSGRVEECFLSFDEVVGFLVCGVDAGHVQISL